MFGERTDTLRVIHIVHPITQLTCRTFSEFRFSMANYFALAIGILLGFHGLHIVSSKFESELAHRFLVTIPLLTYNK